MHPIEHLRFVARAQGADPAMLAAESAAALAQLSFDPSGLVVATRRVIERHPTVGPLWWLCAHLLTADDPLRRAGDLADQLYGDPTSDQLVRDLPENATVMTTGDVSLVADALCRRGDLRVAVVGDDRGAGVLSRRLERADSDVVPVPYATSASAADDVDVVLIEANAIDPQRAVLEPGGGVLAAVAAARNRPVWIVAGRGRRLPSAYVDAMLRVVEDVRPPVVDVVEPATAAMIVGPDGADEPGVASVDPECPFAAELCG